MKRVIALTTAFLSSTEDNSSVDSSKLVLLKVWSILKSIFFSFLGFGVMVVGWYGISLITKGGLPTPLATSEVFWELVKDPFYDYGPNDKGIGLQLGSSLIRVFSGFLLGSLFAIPVGFIMGASAIGK